MGSSTRPAHIPDSSTLVTIWRKSQLSNPSGECVELGLLPDDTSIAMRNSRDPRGPALLFDAETICSFLDAAHNGDLDWTYEHSRYQQVDGGIYVRGGSGETGPGALLLAPPAGQR